MDEPTLRREIERRSPWHHSVELPHGLRTEGQRSADENRIRDLKSYVWPALLEACGGSLEGARVLDLACNCGGFSIEAAQSGAAYVQGVDVVPKYIEQARFLADVLELPQLDFRLTSLDEVEGEFDVVLNFGLLYHLENPVSSMRRVAGVTANMMVVETALHVVEPQTALWRMDLLDPVAEEEHFASTGLWRTARVCQLYPNRRAVEDLFDFLGFETTYLTPPPGLARSQYYDGRRAAFIARRPGGADSSDAPHR